MFGPHPNTKNSLVRSNSGLLLNKSHVSFQDISIDYAIRKMDKSKILPLPTHNNNTTNLFDLIPTDVWGITPTILYVHHKHFVTFY